MHVLIIDDHPTIRNGVAAAITEQFEEATTVQAGCVADAKRLLDDGSVDVAVLDLRLGDETGLDVARHITATGNRARCVVFTSVGTPQALLRAVETGSVAAFIEKRVDVDQLCAAVKLVCDGGTLIDGAAVRRAEQLVAHEGGYDPESLTPRERSIAMLVAEGRSDAKIAQALNIAGSTVRNNLTSIYKKIGVDSRTRLATMVWDLRSKDPDFAATGQASQ